MLTEGEAWISTLKVSVERTRQFKIRLQETCNINDGHVQISSMISYYSQNIHDVVRQPCLALSLQLRQHLGPLVCGRDVCRIGSGIDFMYQVKVASSFMHQ